MEIATSYSSIKDHPKMTYLQVSTEQPTSAQLNSTNMANASGPWRLRFEIVNILDKESDMPPPLYLTNHGLNKVVTVDECGPRQEVRRFNISVDYMTNFVTVPQWYAIPVKGKKDWYIISPEPMAITPPGLARKAPGESVILAGEPDEWRLEFLPIHLNKENVDEIGNGDHYKLAFHLDITLRRTDLFQKDSPP